jgi:Protein of unknown function (DUF1236)
MASRFRRGAARLQLSTVQPYDPNKGLCSNAIVCCGLMSEAFVAPSKERPLSSAFVSPGKLGRDQSHKTLAPSAAGLRKSFVAKLRIARRSTDKEPNVQTRSAIQQVLFWASVLTLSVVVGFLGWTIVVGLNQPAPSASDHRQGASLEQGPANKAGLNENTASSQSPNQGYQESPAKSREGPAPTTVTGDNGTSSAPEEHDADQLAGLPPLTDAQRKRIRAYISQQPDVARTGTEVFPLTLGTAVPKQVRLKRLPAHLAQVLNRFRTNQYVIVGKQLVIVDPNTRRVLAIVPNVG